MPRGVGGARIGAVRATIPVMIIGAMQDANDAAAGTPVWDERVITQLRLIASKANKVSEDQKREGVQLEIVVEDLIGVYQGMYAILCCHTVSTLWRGLCAHARKRSHDQSHQCGRKHFPC